MHQKDVFADSFTTWRRSYMRLRILERTLVTEARSSKDSIKVAALYEQVEAVRLSTSALFHLAQTASMKHYIPPDPTIGDVTVW